MNLQFGDIVALFAMGFIACTFVLIGVALGAYVVFRTRRDNPDPFFYTPPKQGSAGQAPGQYVHELLDDDLENGTDVDKLVYGDPKRREKFLKDIATDVRNRQ